MRKQKRRFAWNHKLTIMPFIAIQYGKSTTRSCHTVPVFSCPQLLWVT